MREHLAKLEAQKRADMEDAAAEEESPHPDLGQSIFLACASEDICVNRNAFIRARPGGNELCAIGYEDRSDSGLD